MSLRKPGDPPALAAADTEQEALARLVGEIEAELDALGLALVQRNSDALECASGNLQRKLSQAVELYRQALSAGRMPPDLRRRLKIASGQVVRHREALTRASVALDRALDALMPGVGGNTVYTDQARLSGASRGRPFTA